MTESNSRVNETWREAAEQLFAEAMALMQRGTTESLEQALLKFIDSIPIFRSIGDTQSLGAVMCNMALIHAELNDWLEVIELSKEALNLARLSGDQHTESAILNNLAFACSSLGEINQAVDYFDQALALARKSDYRLLEAKALNNLGIAYYKQGQAPTALDYYKQALELNQLVNDTYLEGRILMNMGLAHQLLGEKSAALEYYLRAQPVIRETGDLSGEASLAINIGYLYHTLGEREEALEYCFQALSITRATGNHQIAAMALNNIGQIYAVTGNWQKALDSFNQSMRVFSDLGDRSNEARAVLNFGAIYKVLGEVTKALKENSRALQLFRAIHDRDGEAIALNNLGSTYLDNGEWEKALDFLTQTLPLLREVGDRQTEGRVLNNISLAYIETGRCQQAQNYLSQALELAQATRDREGEAAALADIADIHATLHEYDLALGYQEQALALFDSVRDPSGKARVLSSIASIKLNQGHFSAAREHFEAALAIFESLRTKIGGPTFRASYFATVQEYYLSHVALLMALHVHQPSEGLDGAALEITERARARVLLETLTERGANIRRDVDTTLLARERGLRERLNALAHLRRTEFVNVVNPESPGPNLALEIETVIAELQQLEAEIRQMSPHYAALTQPQPLTLAEIQTQVLDADTLLLEYSLGDERSYLWAVTPTSINSYELPKRSEIEEVARRAYVLLNARNEEVDGESTAQRRRRLREADEEYAIVAARLTEMVLAPAWSQFSSKRLLIVSEGALQYIPFGALPVPQGQAGSDQAPAVDVHPLNPLPPNPRPLILDHEIVSVPSASIIAVLRSELEDRHPAEKTVMIFADPVFESCDERVQLGRRTENLVKSPGTKRNGDTPDTITAVQSAPASGNVQFKRLYGTRKEAEQILSFLPPGQSSVAFDFAASLEAATNPELARYRYLHFATHGILDSIYPELSGVVLSLVDEEGQPRDGFLRGHEIFNLKLAAELVTLSACQTGLGKEVKGEGLVGLTRGFMYAGAPRVVVSLWEVDDDSTAELMARFYRGMLKEELRPAAALRAAQISLFKKSDWTAPYYWAAFILQGEWR